jgi:asparagine synthase (glutamine-hydrolysing)
MFGLAIWDRAARRSSSRAIRIGIKPIYYAEHGGRLYFGSEMKSLLRRRICRDDRPATRSIITCRSSTPSRRLDLQGHRKLPPGTC